MTTKQVGIKSVFEEDIFTKYNLDFYIVQLDSVNVDVKIKEKYDYKTSMQLYEDLNREINRSEVYLYVNEKHVWVPDLDNKEIYINRINFVNDFMRECYRGTIMGGLDNVMESVYLKAINK